MKKMLVRNPSKRSTLEVIQDDKWLNDGFDKNPLSIEYHEINLHDREVLEIMELKLAITKKSLVPDLESNVYDDRTAIYFLLHDAKQKFGSAQFIKLVDAMITKSRPSAPNTELPKPAFEVIKEERDSNGSLRGNDSPKPAHQEKQESKLKQVVVADVPTRQRRSTVSSPSRPQIDSGSVTPVIPMQKHDKKDVEKKEANDQMQQMEVAPVKKPLTRRTRTNTVSGPSKRASLSETPSPASQTSDSLPQQQEVSKDCEPRSIRFTFNAKTTSSKSPEFIIGQVVQVCSFHGISHRMVDAYTIEASAPSPFIEGDSVVLEIEVCKLPRLTNLHGLKFKRLKGSTSEYKSTCERILQQYTVIKE